MAETSPAADLVVDRDLAQDARQPEPIIEEQHLHHSQQPAVNNMPPQKRKTRQRLLRGIARMSSTPSFEHAGRARSSSTPYTRSGASLSCVSLAPASSPFAPSLASANGSGSAYAVSPLASPAIGLVSADDYISSTSSASSPPTPFPPFPHSVSCNAIRKVDLSSGLGLPSGGGSVALPHDMIRTASLPLFPPAPKKTFAQLWSKFPHELKINVLRFLRPKELVRLSRVSRGFYKTCFDGQLWTSFDASEFYQDIPVESLSKIITLAGPFVKDLNLRGCIQMEKYQDALLMSSACSNLVNATLEGSLLSFQNLDGLLRRNRKLAHINLTGLSSVNFDSCATMADCCAQLEVLNLSWCKMVTAAGVRVVLESCPKLRDLRVGEVRGFGDLEVAEAFFKVNRLERLVLSGCQDLTDAALCAMMHGIDPEIDLLTDRPIVPPRTLRHLDLSRCSRLTNRGVLSLGHCVPDLEGLVLSGCSTITDAALEPIFASTPRLAYLDLEDLTELTNGLLSNHLAKAPCAESLTHLSISYCEDIGDAGVLPMIRSCKNLRSMELDNTRISDLALAEAVTMVRDRAARTRDRATRPYTGLSITVYDCPHVTWTGVREVLSRNAEILTPRPDTQTARRGPSATTYPTEIIALKCFYGWQMTVDEHTKRVLRGDFAAAARLERKWADYMQANAEAGVVGAGGRRRRRRAREAQQVHADEEEGGAGGTAGGNFIEGPGAGIGRRRARTATCAIM